MPFQSPVLRSSDTDDEPAAKLARFSGTEFNNHQHLDGAGASYNSNSEECFDDEYDEHDWQRLRKLIPESAQAADFDADSEGSDYEIVPVVVTTSTGYSSSSIGGGPSTTGSLQGIPSHSPPTLLVNDDIQVMMETNFEHDNNNLIDNNNDLSIITTIESPQHIVTDNSSPPFQFSPQIIDTIVKRPNKKIDISKFNRSNRKSKNCAIFYFKHLDTDTEQRTGTEQSSQGSESAFRSDNPSSDDEWYYQTQQQNNHNDNDDDAKPLDFFNDDDDDDDNANKMSSIIYNGNGSSNGGGVMCSRRYNNHDDDVVNGNGATIESIDVVDCEIKAEIIETRINIMSEIVKDVEQKVSMVKVIDDSFDAISMKKSLSDGGGVRGGIKNNNGNAERNDYKNNELVSCLFKIKYFIYVLLNIFIRDLD